MMKDEKGALRVEIAEEERKEKEGGDTLSPVTNITMKEKEEGRTEKYVTGERVISHFDPFRTKGRQK